jgi:transposase
MPNLLQVSSQHAVLALLAKGWSDRRIAREVGVHRLTVKRYRLASVAVTSNCATSAGDVSAGSVPDFALLVAPAPDAPAAPADSKCATQAAEVSAGSRSCCSPFADAITPMLEVGLSAVRIFQDLRAGHGFKGSYAAVKRFVATLKTSHPQRVWRIECEPGQELQVDFAMGPMVPGADGKMRRAWVFRAVLSHSRKGYSEAVLRQDTESLLRALENALRAFGGVPALLNLDNMRAAVKKADWFDPELTPKFAEFCAHYHITPMPCRPYSPQHKGKVERSIHYMKDNALRGHTFDSLAALNAHLRQWESTVADTRIHGTTRQQVGAMFLQSERLALQPLPSELFPAYQEARRSVARDGYVEVAKAYYEAPAEHIGRSVWVRWDSRQVRLFNDKLELIISHTRLEPGRFTRTRGVRGLDHGGSITQTADYWLKRCRALGPAAGAWAQRALELRGPEAIRSVIGLCQLVHQHSATRIDTTCARALSAQSSGTPRLRTVRDMLNAHPTATQATAPLQQSLLPFAQSHPLIRELSTYAQFIDAQTQTNNNNAAHTSAAHKPTDHEPHRHPQEPSPPTAA